MKEFCSFCEKPTVVGDSFDRELDVSFCNQICFAAFNLFELRYSDETIHALDEYEMHYPAGD